MERDLEKGDFKATITVEFSYKPTITYILLPIYCLTNLELLLYTSDQKCDGGNPPFRRT
jgi:hypothetical protein